MGAWGAGVFANDTAADWAGDLVEGGSEETVREALATAAEPPADAYLDADEGSEALAAAEVVAAAAGRPTAPDAYSEDVIAWAGRHPDLGADELIALATAAVDRVTGENSELNELWHEDGPGPNEWDEAVAELRRRLAA
jgi:hypothetical protein